MHARTPGRLAAAAAKVIAAAILAAGALGTAYAAAGADCERWVDAQGLVKVGSHSIDAPAASLAGLRKGQQCRGPDDDQPRDCEFIDRDGITYLTDAQGVVRIEARRGRVAAKTALPLGLKLGEPRAEVMRKLQALPPQAPRDQLLGASGKARALASGECIVHGGASPASFFVEFDAKQRLRTIGLMKSNV
jgi:hypothetical protein